MLILASQSPTRKALLKQAGLQFAAVPAEVDERGIEAAVLDAGGDSAAVAIRLAESKALAVAEQHPNAFVIGADQTLALGPALLHKPRNRLEAAAQLDRLRGKGHRLHAAVALVRGGDILWSGVDHADLTMRAFSGEERDQVLDLEGNAVLQSVGSYRLEGPSIRLFEAVNGHYFTILGLPLLPLLAALRHHAPEVLL